MKILTTKEYWDTLPKSTRAYWKNLSKQYPETVICTARPAIRNRSVEKQNRALVRRASTGGRWGKPADCQFFDLKELFARGYIFVSE